MTNTEDIHQAFHAVKSTDGRLSTSHVQRALKCGFNRAAALVEEMEARGWISAPDSQGVRTIIYLESDNG